MLTQIAVLNSGRMPELQTWQFGESCGGEATKSLFARSSGIHEVQVVASVSQARPARYVFCFPANGALEVSVVLTDAR